MDLKARIFLARTEAGMTQQQLADATGKTRSAVAQWESGDVRPRHSTLTMIAKATGKPLRWVESGVDDVQSGLWVVGEVAAGLWKEATAMLKPYSLPVTPDPDYPADAQRVYRIVGNSVNKSAQNGDYIICLDILAANETPRNGDLVVVRRLEHGKAEYTAKIYTRVNGTAHLRPHSDDPDFQDEIDLSGGDGVEIQITDIVLSKYNRIRRGSI